MLKKSINSISLLISGIFFISVGFFSIISGSTLMRYVLLLLAGGIFINALIRFFTKIFSSKTKFELLIRTLIDLIFGAFLFFKIDFVTTSIIVIFGIYLLCHALIQLIDLTIYFRNQVKGKFRIFVNFLVLSILSICLISAPNQNMKYAGIIIGIYFIFYGIINITDFISEVTPAKVTNKIKKKIRIPLPIFLTAFIPQQLISMIRKMSEEGDNSLFYSVKREETPDLEVIIHLANTGTASFGHVEIAFEDKIYSYANYDRHSRKFFDGFGDGVLAIADKVPYIEYNVMNRDRILISFGIKLSELQKEKVKERIEKLMTENTVPYYSDLQLYEMGILKEKKKFRDMSSELYQLANARYLKIIAGKHKTFFVLKTNCAMVAESILRSIGSFIPESGILSPGTYYDYLNGEFQKKNTNVISRIIYTKETLQNLKKENK